MSKDPIPTQPGSFSEPPTACCSPLCSAVGEDEEDHANEEIAEVHEEGIQMSRLVRWAGLGILALSYGLWIPGIAVTLFTYTSIFGTTAKSTLQTIDYLWSEGNYFPCIAVTFFGIVIPILKLIFAFKFTSVVQWISRWATVDAIVAIMIVFYFENQNKLVVSASLKAGFFFFVSYCILSTIAAILLHPPLPSALALPSASGKSPKIWALASLLMGIASLVFVGLGFYVRVLHVTVLNVAPLDISIWDLISAPSWFLIVFVLILPVVEILMMSLVSLRGLLVSAAKPVTGWVSVCLETLALLGMLDVLTLSVLVFWLVTNSMSGMSSTIWVGGYVILILAATFHTLSRIFFRRAFKNRSSRDLGSGQRPSLVDFTRDDAV